MSNNGEDRAVPGTSSSGGSRNSRTDDNCETSQYAPYTDRLRQSIRSRKRAVPQTCPICNKEITANIIFHVERCLAKSELYDSIDTDDNNDSETSEELESADEGVSISEDESGSPQYSEYDMILPDEEADYSGLEQAGNDQEGPSKPMTDNEVIEKLKKKIRELERLEENLNETFKCSICMEGYKNPLTSINCWHVHCEQCWMQILGTKKMCPRCNRLTSPNDLRKVYL